MTASRWTKRHGSLLMSRSTIYFLSIVTPVSLMGALEQWESLQGIALTVAIGVGAFVLAKSYLNRISSFVISRAISAEYEATEFRLRKLLNDANIAFQRQLEEDTNTHSFELVGNRLRLTVRPYDLINGLELGRDDVSDSVLTDRRGVLISLYNVSASNQAFADKLTTAIDDAIG